MKKYMPHTAFLVGIVVLLYFFFPFGGDANMVANTCTSEDKLADVCLQLYKPVCAQLSDETTKTYSNLCFACQDDKVVYWTEGECPD